MEFKFKRTKYPILEMAQKQKGEVFELGNKLEATLKKKYAAARKENWFMAAQCRADEADLRKELEDLLGIASSNYL
jgi:hypothetical protein